MSSSVRIVLLIGALLTFFYVIKGVKKSKFRARETFFWLLLSFIFVLLGIFPGIAEWAAKILHVSSPSNLVYLGVIFLLLIKIFTMDRNIAKTEHQMTELTQKIAIDRLNQDQKENAGSGV